MKEITVALGGGGSKGYAHLGVLRVLEREGYRIRGLSGTSAGGLVGGLYAYGYTPDEILEKTGRFMPTVKYRRDPQDGPSWLGMAEVREFLTDLIGEARFEDLRIPFAVTAVDLNRAEEVVLHSGRLIDALLATAAVPGVFPPITYAGRMLVDGGVMDPVPVGEARNFAPELPVVAVVLSPPMDEWTGATQPRLLGSLPYVVSYIGRFRSVQALNIFMRAVDIGGVMLTEMMLQIDQPEVIVRPALHGIGLLDVVDVEEVASLGERAMEKMLPQLERALSWPQQLRRKLSRQISPRPHTPIRLPASTDFEALSDS